MFLEECRYIAKEKEATRHITEDLEIFSDEENSNEENSAEEQTKMGYFLKRQVYACK